jgi:hypothetical protein
VQLHDMHLEGIGAYVLAEGTDIVHDAFHLHGTFPHTRRRHGLRLHGSQPGDAEFVGLVAIPPLALLLRHRVPAGGERETIHVADQIL